MPQDSQHRPMGPETTLQQRIQDWITEEVGTEAAGEFADAFADQIRRKAGKVAA